MIDWKEERGRRGRDLEGIVGGIYSTKKRASREKENDEILEKEVRENEKGVWNLVRE